MSRPGGGTVRSSFPFTRLWSAQKRIRFAHRVTRHKGRPLLARLSSMVSPTGRYIDRNLVMAQISTSSSGIESVLELTYFPSSLCSYSVPCLILIELIIDIEIRDRIEPSKRILPIVSIFFFSSTRKSFHRCWWHVPRQEIKPLTIILIVIRGEEGGGETRCSKERTIASRFSNVTWENRSRGYQSVISHDIGERYSRNRGRDRLFMQLQRPYVSWNDTKNNARVIFDRGQKSRFTFVCI